MVKIKKQICFFSPSNYCLLQMRTLKICNHDFSKSMITRSFILGQLIDNLVKIKKEESFSVGKQSPCLLSFVYTSYIRYGVRDAPKFGKHASLFSYHKEQKYNIGYHMQCVIIVFLVICVFLETFVDI